MKLTPQDTSPPVALLEHVGQQFGATIALRDISLAIPARRMVGLIGPDGVGKSSLLSLIAGARTIEQGNVMVLGGDMRDMHHRREVCPKIAWMPQGLGKNLYHTLSVYENVDFFARLFGHDKAERELRINELLQSTGLAPFRDRPAGKLSGGMKQKLGLCCALIHDPQLLILDEPTTGVDPLSRAQFWELIDNIRQRQPAMSVLVATAYMEEAERFDWLVAMNAGEVLATGSAAELKAQTGSQTLEQAFIALLPEAQRQAHRAVVIPPRDSREEEIAIEARGLTMRFGNFVAVDHVNFRIARGEIFGFLGSNGCGKSTLLNLIPRFYDVTGGSVTVDGIDVRNMPQAQLHALLGYVPQKGVLFSGTIDSNLKFGGEHITDADVKKAAAIAQATEFIDAKPEGYQSPIAQGGSNVSGGQKQRLSIARAIAKDPKIYLFDDSFSALDFKTDVALRRALKAQTDNATVIIVAQRISTVLHANQILVLDEGRLVGKGTHAQLMASCPEYQEIARSQLSQKELDLKSLNTEKEGE